MSEFASIRVLVAAEKSYERQVALDLLRALPVAGVQTADDAVAAFSMAMRQAPDVFVIDAEMRPHTGLQLAREIRTRGEKFAKTPIVLYSSELSRAFAEAAEAVGVNEVLPKPVSALDLKRCLMSALSGGVRVKPLADRVSETAADRGGGPALKRADWTKPQQKLDRGRREAIRAALDEAKAAMALWSISGASRDLEIGREALERALMEAREADPAVRTALAAARRIADAPNPKEKFLEVAIAGARALIASSDRPAMRQALADAVAEAALAQARRTPRV